MTLKEAEEQGYKYAFMSWQRGYVSRKISPEKNADKIKVYAAGGMRKGLLYYLSPSWRSTLYCHRVYLRKKK